MYEAHIDRHYYQNRICREKNSDEKLCVFYVMHPTSMKHPSCFIVRALGGNPKETKKLWHHDVEFRVENRWIPSEQLFQHRIAELEGESCNQAI